jgi:predicted DNA-binding transcriptional regulator AlpA
MLLDLDISAIPTDQLLPTLTRLAALQSQVAARLMATPAPVAVDEEGDDRLLTISEAAALLKCSPKWFYRHPRLPFVRRLGPRCVRYSEKSLRLWLKRTNNK